MASKTAQTTYRRKLRQKNAGKKARRQRANRGSTPAIPLHTKSNNEAFPEMASR